MCLILDDNCFTLMLTMLQWTACLRHGQFGEIVTSPVGVGLNSEVVHVMVLFMEVKTVLELGKRPRNATRKTVQVRYSINCISVITNHFM